MADIWDELEDASADGRGRPNTTIPRLLGIEAGGREVFGPYGKKGSANTAMKTAAELDAADGLVFRGPMYRKIDDKFYFVAEKPE
jgi:hypothetical protein